MKMNNMRNALLAAAIIGAGAVPTTASAVTIDGISFSAGNYLQIGTIYEGQVTGPAGTATNYTQPITAVNQQLGGIGIVDAIKDSGGNTVWANGDNGTQLTLQFGGYNTESITGGPLPGTPLNINFSGGWANFYADSVAISGLGGYSAFNPSLSPPDPDSLATATNGLLWLATVGGTNGFSENGNPITLQSHIFTGGLANIGSGSGNGFLNVAAIPGDAGFFFDTNTQASGNDIALGSSFNSGNAAPFAVTGSMDLRGNAIPEPGTIALLGLGLLGMGMAARLRRFS